jgi:FkbM family methyltransferase
MTQRLITLIASILAKVVEYRIIPIGLFRSLSFKGKLSIASCLSNSSFPSSGIFQCDGILFDINFNDYIDKFIYLNIYEQNELKLMRKLIPLGSCCIDVGANVGFYSLNIAKIVGDSGRVYSFEPDPANFEKIKKNIQINNYGDIVTPLKIGLSSTTGETVFSRTPDDCSGWGRIGEWESSNEQISINTVTLDEFVDEQLIENIFFLKCDIEGHEFEFLHGASKTLKNRKINYILIEYSGYVLENQGHTVNDYISIFESYGYQPVILNLNLLNKSPKNVTYNLLFHKKQ